MTKVLMAIDGSDVNVRATRRFIQLAKTFGGIEVALLCVQAEPRIYGEIALYLSPKEVEAAARELADQALKSAEDLLQRESVSFTRHIVLGETAESIAQQAQELKCWMIVMGSHGLSALPKVVLGSTTTRVLHLAKMPVLVIPPGPTNVDPLGPLPEGEVNILVAVDGSESALHAVDAMTSRLSWFKRPPRIHLLTVESRTPIDIAIAGMVSADAISAHHHAYAEAALNDARTMLRAAGHSIVEHVAIGDPAREIEHVAKSQHCDLIVMGTRGRGSAAGLVFGSTATKVLHLAEVPVLLVPKGAS